MGAESGKGVKDIETKMAAEKEARAKGRQYRYLSVLSGGCCYDILVDGSSRLSGQHDIYSVYIDLI